MTAGLEIDERTVVAIWERQSFDPVHLHRLGVRVVFRGFPSDAGGPDYQDAMLALADGRLIRGDIEFHVDSADWYQHRHDANPAYDNVILHVVWVARESPTRTSSGRVVPVFALSDIAHDLPDIPAPTLAPHPCIERLATLPTEQLVERIRSAGIQRFRERSEVLRATAADDPDQALYSALLEACGYASNREAFCRLAEVVPYGWLMTVPEETRLAVLLDAARLGPPAMIAPPAHLPHASWRLVRLRPANHPARRLAGIAAVTASLTPTLSEAVETLVARSPRPSTIRAALMTGSGQERYIGSGRADEIAVSVILPFVALSLPAEAEALYRSYPSPPLTRWTRLMLDLLSHAGQPLRVRHAPEHQGLHWLYHNHCRKESRAGCPVCQCSGS